MNEDEVEREIRKLSALAENAYSLAMEARREAKAAKALAEKALSPKPPKK